MVIKVQHEWAKAFNQGPALSGRNIHQSTLYLFLDSTAAMIHKLILGCHSCRYSQEQAVEALSSNIGKMLDELLSINKRQ